MCPSSLLPLPQSEAAARLRVSGSSCIHPAAGPLMRFVNKRNHTAPSLQNKKSTPAHYIAGTIRYYFLVPQHKALDYLSLHVPRLSEHQPLDLC